MLKFVIVFLMPDTKMAFKNGVQKYRLYHNLKGYLPMNDLLTEGLNLMLLGMGAVFIFLIVLVGVTSLMSKVVSSLASVSDGVDSGAMSGAQADSSAGSGPVEPDIVDAISAAVHQYRSR